jgi:hypothetical protein
LTCAYLIYEGEYGSVCFNESFREFPFTVLYYTLCTQMHPKVNGIPFAMEQCGVDCERMLFWSRSMI